MGKWKKDARREDWREEEKGKKTEARTEERRGKEKRKERDEKRTRKERGGGGKWPAEKISWILIQSKHAKLFTFSC